MLRKRQKSSKKKQRKKEKQRARKWLKSNERLVDDSTKESHMWFYLLRWWIVLFLLWFPISLVLSRPLYFPLPPSLSRPHPYSVPISIINSFDFHFSICLLFLSSYSHTAHSPGILYPSFFAKGRMNPPKQQSTCSPMPCATAILPRAEMGSITPYSWSRKRCKSS